MPQYEINELHRLCAQFNNKFQDISLLFEHVVWDGDRVVISLQTAERTVLLVDTDEFNVANAVIATVFNIENNFGIKKET